MTQEDKNILLQDLCARLPHEVKIQIGKKPEVEVLNEINLRIGAINSTYASIKPYLFPMSSMTPRQKAELARLTADIEGFFQQMLAEIDFYHRHHIDYRGLIDMGLAIDATDLNIY